MAIALLVAPMITAVAVPASAREARAAREPAPAEIERVVAEYATRTGYPGIATAITLGDRVLYTGGYGHDSSGAAVTATTPMPVASVSKSFTALAVMRLVEVGKVVLDAPVRDYLPGFRIADPRGERITVRRLLEQTSGLSDGTFPEKSLPQPGSPADAVTRARTATLAADPGTRHLYTNTNYHLAARLVEVVTGEPFAEYMRRQVFGPAGMRSTTTISQTPRDLPPGVREGHLYAYGMSIPAPEPKRFVGGSDGVITTAEDMATWLITQNGGGVAPNGTRLLSAEGVRTTHTPSDRRWTYGLGWDTDARGRVSHSGIWFTYTAHQLLLPGGYGIAVIGNGGIGLGNEGIGALAEELATLVTGGSPETGSSLRLIIDLVLACLTLLSLALGVRNLRRTGRWAGRFVSRPAWRLLPRLLPRLFPLVLLVFLPRLLGMLAGGGRDLTHLQLFYYSVALVTWTAVATLSNLAVLTTRVVALVRLRRTFHPGQ
ncbi:serine hydrolase domain-containing protein [Streptosporangium sp. NPDC001559]|uniref:serine hydrolase domain-containing protein n=1 Tax=Streptosporangium sp. NPDC001559 TaxID=3366187 RepID=UPI0036EDF7DB